jgi:hypothetical protein
LASLWRINTSTSESFAAEQPNQRLLLPGPAASTFGLVVVAGAADPRSRSAMR